MFRLAARSLAMGEPEKMFADSKGEKMASKEAIFSNAELSHWLKEFENGAGTLR